MRVLVTVASRHGGTREIGSLIATELTAGGHEVELVDVGQVTSVDGYDAVLIGSPMYTGHWLPAAREFASRFAADLLGRPVWLFSSGLSTAPAEAANSPVETRAVLAATGARGHRAFGGRLNSSVLDVDERAIIAAASSKEGDHRDLVAVVQWAREISDQLTQVATTAAR